MTDTPLSPRVLIVEDEIAIAVLIEEELVEAGFEPVGPAGTVEHARALIASEALDAAILDINISGRSVDEILAPLLQRRVPMIVMTGYDDRALPVEIAAAPRFTKPFHVPDLVARLPDLIGRSRTPAIALAGEGER